MRKVQLTILALFCFLGAEEIYAQARPAVYEHIAARPYRINDLIAKDGVIYKCVVAGISTPPSANWEEIGAATDDQVAVEVPITDTGDYFTGTEVEAGLQEAGAKMNSNYDTIVILAGTLSTNATAINVNLDSINAHNTRINTNLDSLTVHNTRLLAVENSGGAPTELSLGTVNSTSIGITSDGSVDDVIIPTAIAATSAGLLSGSDKYVLDNLDGLFRQVEGEIEINTDGYYYTAAPFSFQRDNVLTVRVTTGTGVELSDGGASNLRNVGATVYVYNDAPTNVTKSIRANVTDGQTIISTMQPLPWHTLAKCTLIRDNTWDVSYYNQPNNGTGASQFYKYITFADSYTSIEKESGYHIVMTGGTFALFNDDAFITPTVGYHVYLHNRTGGLVNFLSGADTFDITPRDLADDEIAIVEYIAANTWHVTYLPNANFTSGGGATTLNALTDVTAPSPSTGDHLEWNGSAWINAVPSVTAGETIAQRITTATAAYTTLGKNVNDGEKIYLESAASVVTLDDTNLDIGWRQTFFNHTAGDVTFSFGGGSSSIQSADPLPIGYYAYAELKEANTWSIIVGGGGVASLSVATTAEVNTGTDNTKAITPLALDGSSPAFATPTMTDNAFAVGWNGSTALATRNAIYDEMIQKPDFINGVSGRVPYFSAATQLNTDAKYTADPQGGIYRFGRSDLVNNNVSLEVEANKMMGWDDANQRTTLMNDQVWIEDGGDASFNSNVLATAFESAIVRGSTAQTGSALSLTSQTGGYYNMATASTATNFTTSGQVIGGWAITLINNSTSEPTLNGGTAGKLSGATWVSGTDFHMVVQYYGTTIQYYFLAL